MTKRMPEFWWSPTVGMLTIKDGRQPLLNVTEVESLSELPGDAVLAMPFRNRANRVFLAGDKVPAGTWVMGIRPHFPGTSAVVSQARDDWPPVEWPVVEVLIPNEEQFNDLLIFERRVRAKFEAEGGTP